MMHLARHDRDGWQLESAEKRHEGHPDTFWIPSRQQRESLGVGAGAKLLFAFSSVDSATSGEGGERMWVIVRRREGGHYVGVLDSTPTSGAGKAALTRGASIVFTAEHVADITAPSRDYVVSQYGQEFFE